MNRPLEDWEVAHLRDMAFALADVFVRDHSGAILRGEDLTVIAAEYGFYRSLTRDEEPETTDSRQSVR